MPSRTKANIVVLTANFLFGANYFAVKYITPSRMEPLSLNVVRVVVSVGLFWLVFLVNPSRHRIQKQDIPRFLLCSMLGVAINQILFIKGLSLTTSIHGALLMLVTPIFITMIAAWLGKEGLSLVKILGLVLGISGAAVLILFKENTHTGSNILLGDLCIILNAISYAFYLVLVKPLMLRYSPIQVIRWVFTIGSLMILPIGWNSFIHTNWAGFDVCHFAALAFVVVGATFLAYLFNIYGVSRLGASATGSYIYTQPLFATLIAVSLGSENFNTLKLFAGLLIFSGVYLVNVKNKRS